MKNCAAILVAGAADEYQKLRRIVAWAHNRWKHDGSNEPSRPDPLTILREASQGKQFRCVEYATVIAGAATALGTLARRLVLKTRDVETRPSGAGHVVAEVWLRQLSKWVFADGQFNIVPEREGVPLTAVELPDAIAAEARGLVSRSSPKRDLDTYVEWERTCTTSTSVSISVGMASSGAMRAVLCWYLPVRRIPPSFSAAFRSLTARTFLTRNCFTQLREPRTTFLSAANGRAQ